MTDHIKSWASGFIDGEGCLRVDLKRAKDGRKRDLYYLPMMTITLREDNAAAMKAVQIAIEDPGYLFNRGRYAATEKRYVSNPCIECAWKSKSQTMAVVRLLDEYPLQGKKAAEYVLWREAVMLRKETNPDDGRLEEIRNLLQELKRYHE